MNMSFYSAAVGAEQQQIRLQVQGNNIANVNTYGYRAEKVSFGELMNMNVRGIDDAELPKGTGTRVIQAQTDFKTNNGYHETDRPLDFAIVGDGFFALYDLESGEVSFTRDGAFMKARFEVEPAGGGDPVEVWRLSDNEGRCVLNSQGNFIVLQPDNVMQTTDNPDDRIYRLEDLDIGVFDYAIHEGLQHLDSQRFLPTEKNGQLYMGTGTIKQGLLEASNTDLALEFVKVIETQRAYGACLKMMITSDEIESTINGLR
ncbi:MAG: flagellar hook basal-body protein [Oscillospiraceae bacterium]|nr:flagellar hook basal-body protein [Oscillospiraceae bacterium]